MSVDKSILSEFIKITNDSNKKENKPVNIYGTIVTKGGVDYVKIDGSDILTPFRSTMELKTDERVILNIQNHRATITGNLTDPPSSGDRVDDITQRVSDAEGNYSELKQTSQEISAKVVDLQGGYSELKQTSQEISSKVVGLDGKYSELKQTVDGIDLTGMVTFNDLSTEGRTKIHGGNIETDSLMATGEIGFANGARITPYPSHVPGAFGLSISAPGVTIGAGSWSMSHTGDATFDGILDVMPNQFTNDSIAGYASGFKAAASGSASVGKSIYANSFLSRYSTMAVLSRDSVEPDIESLNTVKIGDSYKIQVLDVMPLNRSIDENPYLKTDEEFGIGLDLESVVATLLSTVKKQSEEINNLKAEVFKHETN